MASKISRGTIEQYFVDGGYGFLKADGRESRFYPVEPGEVFFFKASDLPVDLVRLADRGQLVGRRVEFKPGYSCQEERRNVLEILDLPSEYSFETEAFGVKLNVSVVGDIVPKEILARLIDDHVRSTWGGYQRGEGPISAKLPIPDGTVCDEVPLRVTYVTAKDVICCEVKTLKDWGTDVEVVVRKGILVHMIEMESREHITGYTYQMPNGVEYTEGYQYEVVRWPVSLRSLRAKWYWHARIIGTGSFLEDAKEWDFRELEPSERADALEKLRAAVEEKAGKWTFNYPRSEVVHFVEVEKTERSKWPERYDVLALNSYGYFYGPMACEVVRDVTIEEANAKAKEAAMVQPDCYVIVVERGKNLPSTNPDAWMHNPRWPEQGPC